jgi:hypothetical protein
VPLPPTGSWVGAPSTYRFSGRCPPTRPPHIHLPVLGSVPPPPTGSWVGAPSTYRSLGRCPPTRPPHIHLPVLRSVPPPPTGPWVDAQICASCRHCGARSAVLGSASPQAAAVATARSAALPVLGSVPPPPTGSRVGAPSTYRFSGRCPLHLPVLGSVPPPPYRFSGRCPLHLPVLGSVPPPPYRFSGRCPLHLPVLGSVPPPPTGSRVGAHMRSCHDYGARSADSWVGAPHPQLPSLRRALQPNGPVPSAPQPPTC